MPIADITKYNLFELTHILKYVNNKLREKLIMSDCCSSNCLPETPLRKHVCPVNGIEYSKVSLKTILHHIKKPWQWNTTIENYYFCNDPNCDVVYFGEDDSIIYKDDLRTTVGIKDKSSKSIICYCFGVSKQNFSQDKTIKDFVIHQTKDQMCGCEIRNPSGKCCLKDFPKFSNDLIDKAHDETTIL